MGYLTNFIVYMLAMVGVLVVAMLVFKHTAGGCAKSSSGKCLKVLDTLSIGPRKTLYIVSAGNEKFLIAGDTERTSLISKLNPKETCEERISAVMTTDKEDYSTKSYADRTFSNAKRQEKDSYTSVMRSLAIKMQGGKCNSDLERNTSITYGGVNVLQPADKNTSITYGGVR